MAIRRPWFITVLVVSLLTVAAIAVATLADGSSHRDPAQGAPGDRAPAPATTSPSAPSAAPAPAGAGRAAPAGPAAAASEAPLPGGDQAAVTTDDLQPGVEMQESPDVALPGRLRATREQRAAQAELSRVFPALQVRRGALVADHPPTAVPVPDGATIRSSSVASEDGATQVAVVAEVAAPLDRVLRFYRSRYARLGFREAAPQPTASGSATSFRRAPHSVVVATHRAGSSTVVSVLAMLRTDG